jgi:signal transduction histidine kinase
MTVQTNGIAEPNRYNDRDGDHWEQFVSRTIHYVTLATLPMLAITLVLWLLYRQYGQLLILSGMAVLVVVGDRAHALLRGRGHGRAGIQLFLIAFWGAVTVCTLVLPEMLPATALAYGIMIVLGIAVLSHRESTWLAVACVLGFAGIAVLGQLVSTTWFPPVHRSAGMLIRASFGAVTLVAAAQMYRLMIAQQRVLLERAHRDNLEIRKRIEAERAQRAQLERAADELARSNTELERFAYIASHDLQEPLRKIQAFGDRLQSRYAEVLDERGHEYLRRMQSAARRGQSRVNDLLVYSRVTTRGKPFVAADLNQVAHQVLSDLEADVQRSGARVEVTGLPPAEADPDQMGQLLHHLLDNALKFCPQGTAPVIEVSGEYVDTEKGQQCQIAVRDNGIGFDVKYLDRIFQPFQRLHGGDAYRGTGMGLAICRKIAERHGGSITAQSAPGEGATFTVTLPVKHTYGGKE